jgi:hypothetical protein
MESKCNLERETKGGHDGGNDMENFRRIRKASRFMKFEKSNHTNGPRRSHEKIIRLEICIYFSVLVIIRDVAWSSDTGLTNVYLLKISARTG